MVQSSPGAVPKRKQSEQRIIHLSIDQYDYGDEEKVWRWQSSQRNNTREKGTVGLPVEKARVGTVRGGRYQDADVGLVKFCPQRNTCEVTPASTGAERVGDRRSEGKGVGQNGILVRE
jgi:hypothetical protein